MTQTVHDYVLHILLIYIIGFRKDLCAGGCLEALLEERGEHGPFFVKVDRRAGRSWVKGWGAFLYHRLRRYHRLSSCV